MGLSVYLTEAGEDVFDLSITHNLTTMADKAGIYYYIWRPEELGVYFAKDLIEPLSAGLCWLIKNKEEALKHNPSNGWGTYDSLLNFVFEYMKACRDFPNAKIYACR